MDKFGASELRRLTAETSSPCVSVYLATHVAGGDGQQDPVRLKNLLQRAEDQLSPNWLRPVDARRLLSAARNLPADPVFWDHRLDGLAIFVAPAALFCYRLPLPFEELLIVNRRFHVKPLLPLLTGREHVFILALSQNRVRFFSASRFGLREMNVPGLPTSMKSALNYATADRGLQAHSAMHGSLGKQAAVFHGQGGQVETHKEDLARFFRLIDAALQPLLRDQKTPLVLAGVEYLLPIYREVCSYAHVAERELAGNCDYLTIHQLHQRAKPLIESMFQRACGEAAMKYRELEGSGRTSNDVRQVVPAAHEGRVETLFVDVQTHLWGTFDPQSVAVTLHDCPDAGDDDLLDLAAVETLVNRGTVYPLQRELVPGATAVAGVFRY